MSRKHRKSRGISQGRSFQKRKNTWLWIAGIVLVALVLWVLSGHLPFLSIGSKKGKSFSVQGGETRPVLSPSLFVGMASEAYAAAKQFPEVMDQVYCYCTCDEPPTNHKSLLSCFTDHHGAG
jgi:hypothetical protein